MTEPMRGEDEVRAMLALDAVGALTDEERAELAVELRDRPDLQAELAELRAAAMLLADAASEPPPPSLRDDVLAAVAATPQDPVVAPVIPLSSRRRVSRWVAAGAVAAAVMVAVTAGLIVTRTGDDADEDQIAAVLEDTGARTIAMEGELTSLSIVYSASEDAAVLTGRDLPVPSADRVYELWAVRGTDAPERVDIFRPDDEGSVELLLVDLDPDSARWAITEEPPGGSAAPTTPILASTA